MANEPPRSGLRPSHQHRSLDFALDGIREGVVSEPLRPDIIARLAETQKRMGLVPATPITVPRPVVLAPPPPPPPDPLARLLDSMDKLAAVAREAIEKAKPQVVTALTTKRILAEITHVWGVRLPDLQGPCREKLLAWARHMAYAAIHRYRPDLSNGDIGRLLGNRDPSTIIHGTRQHEERMALPEYAARWSRVRAALDGAGNG